jgi:hypothetical protein
VTSVPESPAGSFILANPKSSSLAPPLRQHHVARLQVAVDHPPAVRGIERAGDLDCDLQRLFDRHGSLAQPRFQALAFEILHHQELDRALAADVVQRADVRMVQAGDGPRLALEALGEVARANLDRNRPIQSRVARAKDLAHPPGTQRGDDLIGPQSSVCR